MAASATLSAFSPVSRPTRISKRSATIFFAASVSDSPAACVTFAAFSSSARTHCAEERADAVSSLQLPVLQSRSTRSVQLLVLTSEAVASPASFFLRAASRAFVNLSNFFSTDPLSSFLRSSACSCRALAAASSSSRIVRSASSNAWYSASLRALSAFSSSSRALSRSSTRSKYVASRSISTSLAVALRWVSSALTSRSRSAHSAFIAVRLVAVLGFLGLLAAPAPDALPVLSPLATSAEEEGSLADLRSISTRGFEAFCLADTVWDEA
mmetsp:Transcript_52112/g.76289  ORF Transcript_52112/g.76289 Transcript_52112/m.76289 type:complete len:269 (-) Transcript_52112:1704-2510(-)